jgi:hypothetical protein
MMISSYVLRMGRSREAHWLSNTVNRVWISQSWGRSHYQVNRDVVGDGPIGDADHSLPHIALCSPGRDRKRLKHGVLDWPRLGFAM